MRRQGALRRRPRRLRRRRDADAGARRRRAGRGRLRAAAGGGDPRGRRQGWRPQGLRGLPAGQCRLPADVRQQGRDRRRLRQGQARGEAQGREQPALAGVDGAAGRGRRLQRGGRLLHALQRLAEPARLPHGDVAPLPRAGKPDPGGGARRRRRLRPQGQPVSRRRAGGVGVAPHPPSREVDGDALGKHADRPLRARDRLLRRARARRARQDSGAAGEMPVPARRLFRRRRAGGGRVLGALHPGGLRHPDHAHHVAGPVHQHLAVRSLSRRRAPGGGLFHGAADRARRAHDRHGSGGDQAPQPDPAGQAALRDADAVELRQRRIPAPDGQVHRVQRLEGLRRRARRPRPRRASCGAARSATTSSSAASSTSAWTCASIPAARSPCWAARIRTARATPPCSRSWCTIPRRAARIHPLRAGRHRPGPDRPRHLCGAQRHRRRQCA